MTKTFSDRKNHGFPTRRIAQIRYIKFKISKSRTSKDFINHLSSTKRYVIKNKVKRFILVTDNASFHASRKMKMTNEQQKLKERDDRELVLSYLYEMGEDVLALGESQFPVQTKILVNESQKRNSAYCNLQM